MKLVCIDSANLSLTYGRSYDVIRIGENAQSYYISNDKGEECLYTSSRFLKINEYRDKQLNNILNGS